MDLFCKEKYKAVKIRLNVMKIYFTYDIYAFAL